MASDFPKLSLDLSPPIHTIPSSFPEFLTRFFVTGISNSGANSGELTKLNNFINGLEDEVKKIQAFQRELPLSFLLLNDAISKLKEVAKKNEENPWDGKLDASIGVKLGIDEFEKKTWMSSAQLWSPISEEDDYEPPRRNEERGVLLSFTEASDDVPGLSLVPPGLKNPATAEPGTEEPRTCGTLSGSFFPEKKTKVETKRLPYQTARKRRRCWSPELHRRFLDALEKLGGSQVATPKQIRELMQVDGLTNDEVKSHLQKYRLHVQKLPAANITTQLSTDDIGMGGRDQLELGCSIMDLQHSSSPKGPLHLGRSRKCNSSSVEDDEEENSDGHSWKAQNHM